MPQYEFLPDIVRYRDTRTGRFVPQRTVSRYAEASITVGQDAADVLAQMVSSRQISPAEWERLMRQEIKSTFLQEAMLGRGGRASMTQSDWGTGGQQLREQYDYLRGFREDIENDLLSEGQIRARSHLYFLASKAAYEKGHASAWDIKLPGYPTVDTECQTGCKCYWYIRRQDARTVLATWTRTAAESCRTCLDRADKWANLVYIDGVLQSSERLVDAVLYSKSPAALALIGVGHR